MHVSANLADRVLAQWLFAGHQLDRLGPHEAVQRYALRINIHWPVIRHRWQPQSDNNADTCLCFCRSCANIWNTAHRCSLKPTLHCFVQGSVECIVEARTTLFDHIRKETYRHG